MAGMLSHLAAAGSHLPIMLLHAGHDEDAFALRGQIRDDIATLPNASMYVCYEQAPTASCRCKASSPAGWTSRRFNYPTMRRITCADRFRSCRRYASALIARGVAPRDIQYEVFGPDLWQADHEQARK